MLRSAALKLIRLYRVYIRTILPSCCRFTPSCSEYAQQAITKYGFLKGGLKAARRLSRCHPFSGSAGFDPLV
ncbi:MAG: membrane protein insertion efficiency factor YidD [Candidatus Omnitrophota bacterium]